MNTDVIEVFGADKNLTYSDGDLVGICNDGLVRPLEYGCVVNYIGVVTSFDASSSEVSVLLVGKKECCVKVNSRDLTTLIGKKVLAIKGENAFVVWDNIFDVDKKYDGIILGGIYETARSGVVKATVLLK